jgi:hypothetical protein
MTHLLLPYALVACGLLASMALFISIKREMRLGAARSRKRVDEIVQQMEQAHTIEPEPLYFPPAPPRSGLNLSKRVQAMRMVRRHEDISHITAALGVTRKEVELLIRVQKMAAERVV